MRILSHRLAALALCALLVPALAQNPPAPPPDPFAQQQLARLLPQRPGVADLYVVLVGAYGDEAVFAREVATVRNVLEARFDARGRVVQMVNNKRRDQPAEATVEHLAQVLDGLGKIIDRDQDLVLLHITTHGSEMHQLWFTHAGRELEHLTPPALRKMLDASGIRNRVLSISACYAGGFIRPLADPHTMIVTAAEATRKSYGCGNDSQITEFSRAFYDKGLRATHSFESSFRYAQDTIYKDERARGVEHSNPQMFVGPEIKPQLRQLNLRLAARR